jgi:Ni/Fe-hydrogenase 1 B-type cytochrome subunit
VAAQGIDPALLVPYAPETYDKAAYDVMRALRQPVVAAHYYGFYVLLAFGLIHIVAVVITELRGGGNLVSAMITGKKVLSEAPADRRSPSPAS